MNDVPTQPDLSPEARLLELERELATQHAAHQVHLIRSEMKAIAIRAGMVDLDGLTLLDLTAARLGANGEVEHADRLMEDFRRAKPWLFKTASSSTTAPTPPSTPPAARRATTMTHAEWQSARAELLKHR
jgi:hypothetical protein